MLMTLLRVSAALSNTGSRDGEGQRQHREISTPVERSAGMLRHNEQGRLGMWSKMSIQGGPDLTV